MTTYLIIGTLTNAAGIIPVCQVRKAPNILTAINSYEVDGWRWERGEATAHRLDEAMLAKMPVAYKLIKALQPAVTGGGNFAKAMFDCLIIDWGADKYQIDQDSLMEMGIRHFIDCAKRGVDLGSPAEFVKYNLGATSDYGLSKMGLTREKYESVTYTPKQMRLL